MSAIGLLKILSFLIIVLHVTQHKERQFMTRFVFLIIKLILLIGGGYGLLQPEQHK
jgi:hypothetical protein